MKESLWFRIIMLTTWIPVFLFFIYKINSVFVSEWMSLASKILG